MALKALMLRKKIDERKKALETLRTKSEELQKREEEMEAAIEEVTAAEEEATVEAAIEQLEQDKAAHAKEVADLEKEVEELEAQLGTEERAQDTTPKAPAKKEEREDKRMFETREFMKMSLEERTAIFAKENVKAWIAEIRTAIQEKRALTNVGLTIPEDFMGVLRANVERYSKLYKHVTVRRLNGKGREVVQGIIPEAVWTDACANLNELSLGFSQVELDCYKLGGYFAVCNAVLEDSDLDLAATVLDALGQAIGKGLDHAIIYGTGTKMPLGIVTRLAQSSEPVSYPSVAPSWTDLSSTNVATIASTATDAALFKAFTLDAGAAKGRYSRGEKVWVMNEKTYTKLIANALTINAAGAIVAGVQATMPVVGGVIEVLDFIQDDVIVGGYFDLYVLGERRSAQLASSEHYRFVADETVFKGTARYDGTPIADAAAFVAIGIDGAVVNASSVFPSDTANA